ncbi:MAG: adenylate/guanylate cyclase domain-containing protein [Rhodoferax sp.]
MTTSGNSVAVLFADVAGSTRLYDSFGDTRAKQLVDECLDVMRVVIAKAGGYVVKTIGDEIMCVLPDAEKAWMTAADIQIKIADLPVIDGHKRAVRIGFHVGLVIKTQDDVFGDTVNMAARMTGLAKGGQIMTTGATVSLLPKLLRGATRKIANLPIKGKEEEIAVYEVIWQVSDDMTMALPSRTYHPRLVQLHLSYRGDTLVMNQLCQRIVMGRDLACHVVVSDKMASRHHACIELRLDKFFLIDQSTNGTYVLPDGESQYVLRREEIMLQGSGRIAFGRSIEDTQEDVVFFKLTDST